MVSRWRVSVDVPWDELGVVVWLSCDCLRLGVVVWVDSCYRVGL